MTALTFDNQISFSPLGGILAPASYVDDWDNSLPEQYTPYSTSISSSIDKVLFDLLEQGVMIKNSTGVEDFLKSNYGVVAYLYEAPNRIRKYFINANLEIGVFSDTDNSEDQPELYFEITTSLSPKEASEKLSALNREWLFVSGDQDLMSLNITLKFL